MQDGDRVLELLYDARDRRFGIEELASVSGLVPADLHAVLSQLRGSGHELDLSADGVQLGTDIRLNAHLIERGLRTRRVGKSVICFEEVGSTNDVGFDLALESNSDGTVVLAESQRSGRGRMNRRWVSPFGKNILLSVLLIDTEERLGHGALTIAAGLAVAQGIEDTADLPVELKWPNDVMIAGRKTAGVLVELRRVHHVPTVVIGIGINTNASPPDDQVDGPVTSIADELGHPVDRIVIVRSVLRRLDEWIERIERGDLDQLRETWVSRCAMLSERITVLHKNARFVGRALDISPLEGVILQTDDGGIVRIPVDGSVVLDYHR